MQKEVFLRLSPKGQDQLIKALRDIGEDGQRMAAKIERASKQANRGLKSVDAVVVDLRGGFDDLADRAGIAGSALKALGPAGTIAAASIGALVLGLGAAVRVGKEAVDTFAEIGRASERLGLATETFQALTAEADAQGIASTQLETALRALQERQSQIVTGQGELYSRLKDTNPELLRQLEALDSNEDRLRAVTSALSRAESETDRLRIAYAAFGEAGADVSKILLAADGDMEQLIEKGRELGLVIDDQLIRRSEDLQVELEAASRVMDLQLKQAFVDFAPVALDTIKFLGEITAALADVANAMREVENRSSRFNLQRQSEIESRLIQGGVDSFAVGRARDGGDPLSDADLPSRFNFVSRREMQRLIREFNQIAATETERAAIEFVEKTRRELAGLTSDQLRAELEATQGAIQARRDGSANFGVGRINEQELPQFESRAETIELLIKEAEAREANAKATREQIAAEEERKRKQAEDLKNQRELLALRRQAAQLLLQLGDATEVLALKEAELNKLVDANLITRDQAGEALKIYEERVTGVTQAVDRWAKVAEGTLTPVEQLNQSISELQADLASGALGEGARAAVRYEEAMRALAEALDLAKQAEIEASEEFKAGAEIRERLAEIRRASMTEDELLRAEEARVEALVASGNLTRQEATEYLRAYGEELKRARDQVSLLDQAERVLDGVMTGRIETVGDLGRAIAALVVDMIRQAAIAQAQIGNNQGFGGFLQGIVGGVFGGFGLGGQTIAPTTVPVSHSGSIVGAGFPANRSMRSQIGSNERLVVAEVGQEIVPADDRKQIINYLRETSEMNMAPVMGQGSGLMPLSINLNIDKRGRDGDVDVEARQSGSNDLDIDVVFKDRARAVAGNGDLNSALEAQGFVRNSLR